MKLPLVMQELFALIPFQKDALSGAHSVRAVKKGNEMCEMAFLCPHPQPALPRASAGARVTCWFAFPSSDPFFFQNHVRLLSAHLAREGMGSAGRALGPGAETRPPPLPPRCPLAPARLVAPGEDGSAPGVEPLQSPAHSNAFPLACGLG